ncbi:sodium-dependent transporter [Treponema sp. TIM-1]|uniref:sodium-dependent transporter n=1 Tax=Treponema sp. TIM-1 TaxID=2898417 RepID=UPI003980EFB6
MSDEKARDSFSGRWGFIIACIGSAVGMANVWAFPYRTARYGGAAFLIPYFICILILGATGVVEETAFGRWGGAGPLGTFRKALTQKNKPFKEIGVIPVIAAFGIGTGYAIIMGWVLRYLWGSISGAVISNKDTGAYFGQIVGNFGSIGWHLTALGITFIMMIGGISKSIEKVCKVMMPVFYLLFIYMAIRVALLPGVVEGYKYLFIPQWSYISDIKTWIFALGQAFFSLSLAGNGTVVYGSYLSKKENVLACAKNIAIFDTLAAILASIVIVPAVFALLGADSIGAGPPLIFITLPAIFQQMAGGQIFAIIFFLAIFFAAATSIVNIFETPIEMLQDRFKLSRFKSVIIILLLASIGGVFLENADIIGVWMDIMSIYVCPLGAFIAAIIFFWVMGKDFAAEQIQLGREKKIGKWVVPLGKYGFCAIAFLVFVLSIAFGGIG